MPGTGIAVSEHFGALLAPGLTEVFWEEYSVIPSVIPLLYSVKTSSKATETDQGIGSMGLFPEFEGRIEYDSPEQLWPATWTHTEFAKGFQIERTLYDDNQYDVMRDRAIDLGRAAFRTRETKAAALFNDAASAVGYDGVPLISANHPLSPSDATVQGNLFALALSNSSISTVRLAMRGWTDDRGNLANVQPDTLIVPPELEEQAWKIVQTPSIYEPGSANLTGNFHRSRYNVVVWDFLTDSTRWFLADSRLMKRFLKWYDRIPLEFGQTEDFDTMVAKFRAYMRFSLRYSNWRWIASSKP
jgi:phage major head subunit gpT-like protein